MVLARTGALVTSLLVLGGVLTSCMSTARVSNVYMALDGNGDRERSVFFTDTKEIHCIVEVGIGRKGVTLQTVVRQLQAYDFVGDRFFPTDRVTASVESSPTPTDGIQKSGIALNPQAPDGSDAQGGPYLPGRFQCEAYLDGDLEQIAIFNVDFPDCPASTIFGGTACLGFYRQNLRCPKYGVTSKDVAKCTCSATKGWECDP